MKDTICAIGTLVGDSSINLIRISGDDSIKIVNKIFNRDLTKKESHTITYGFIMDKNEKVDEVLVSIFKSPKTFTREDIVEINTHGGKMSVNKIMELLLLNGCRMAEPGEFLKRAFLNGRIDLVEAESVSDMINSSTDAARRMSMKGINASFVIGKTATDEVRISCRSDGTINVQLLAEKMSGGGHFTQAACTFKHYSLEAAETRLLNVLNDYLNDARVVKKGEA